MEGWQLAAGLIVLYLLIGTFLAALLWQGDAAHDWRARDWLSAVTLSPIIYVSVWLEDVRRPKQS